MAAGRTLQAMEAGFEGVRDGESAGARTQDQRLKRAMLYQLSYALGPHCKGSIRRLEAGWGARHGASERAPGGRGGLPRWAQVTGGVTMGR